MEDFKYPLSTAIITRTLVAAGYTINDFHRQPRHGEFFCERLDGFRSVIRYLFVVCDTDEPILQQIEHSRRTAQREGRVLVVVARSAGADWVWWDDFLEALGGAVPTWRALVPDYPEIIEQLARNQLPRGMTGEAWLLFEEAVADGLEFVFARRVRRLGGRRRGLKVSDMIALTPDQKILVVDAKASSSEYEVSSNSLRPLREYVETQKVRQRGHLDVSGALIVADRYKQKAANLNTFSKDFLAETGVPLAFLEASLLVQIVKKLASHARLRNQMRWSRLFCGGGSVSQRAFESECEQALGQSYSDNCQ